VTPAVVDRIVAQGYSLDFGARSMRRAVTDVLENAIAEKILKDNVQRGGAMEIT
jgi:ATP-dependent Clp protease ATP-binding subunit ClpC